MDKSLIKSVQFGIFKNQDYFKRKTTQWRQIF